MNRESHGTIRKPRSDERIFWDILMGIRTAQAVLVAHALGIFRLLAEKPCSLGEVAGAVNIADRPAEMILTVCVSYGLLQAKDGLLPHPGIEVKPPFGYWSIVTGRKP